MSVVWTAILSAAGKALMSLLLSTATKEFFEEMLLWLAEKGAKSTKTTWDDEFVAQLKEAKTKADAKSSDLSSP